MIPPFQHGMLRKRKQIGMYQNIPSIILPVVHEDDLPVPVLPKWYVVVPDEDLVKLLKTS